MNVKCFPMIYELYCYCTGSVMTLKLEINNRGFVFMLPSLIAMISCGWIPLSHMGILHQITSFLSCTSQFLYWTVYHGEGEYTYPNYWQAKSHCHGKDLFNFSVHSWTHQVTFPVFHFWCLWISLCWGSFSLSCLHHFVGILVRRNLS